jgi:hypothetical protein
MSDSHETASSHVARFEGIVYILRKPSPPIIIAVG